MAETPLEFRLLGELQIVAKGQEVSLPASKKTRALLAYLVATATPHRREWLCDLLWEGPDDPRRELRWSLAKIRPLLDTGGTTRLESDRSRVAFVLRDAVIDLTTVRGLLADIPNAPLEGLKTAASLFRGEFLDGLDLPACYRFQEWCLAERAAVSTLRLDALRALADRLSDRPEEALVHARALVASDPLSEEGHARVIRLLGHLGRRREAMAQYEQARSVLEREAGIPLSGALERARHAIGRMPVEPRVHLQTGGQVRTPDRPWSRAAVPLVGRVAERMQIDRLISATANGRATPVLLVTGEPGIGKSRLLDHLAERMAMIGGRCLRGRAFEAEAAHPYGAWIDAVRSAPVGLIPEETRQHLALLRPELGPLPVAPTDRARLFDAVLLLLRHLARTMPLAILLDDLQWVDEGSAMLLHYVARLPNAPEAVLFAGAARSGELADNLAISHTLRALDRDERLQELPLPALNEAETRELVHALDPDIDAAAVFAESDGNPLFTLELSRTRREGRHEPGRPLQAIIAGQFASLDEPSRTLLAWASAAGRTVGVDLLARVTGFETTVLLTALEQLERRGLIRTADADSYDFVHDIVRRASYHEISQPRRKLMHGRIARVLDAMVETSDAMAGDLVRHAELAGDHALAARACVIAGERSLRLFANADALALVRRGRSHLDRLPDDPLRRELAIGLFRVEVLAAAGPTMRPPPRIADELESAVADAEAAGLHAAAATGHYLLSVVHQETGNVAQARLSTVRAAEVGRETDRQTFARQLANTARCLIELETEIPRARALLDEAETLLGIGAQAVCELQWGRGLLARWLGRPEEAAARIDCALGLARKAEDRWREYKCLTWLALIQLERCRYPAARDLCRELRVVAGRLGETETPLADAIATLADFAEARHQGSGQLEAALAQLRAVDDKSHLAYALNWAAALCLARHWPEAAKAYGQEALEAARAMRRQNDIAIAKAVLARIEADHSGEAAARIRRLCRAVADNDRFNARARAFIEMAACGLAASGVAPPLSGDRKRRTRR
ncbi:MAG: AAA family ATPase [Pseudomonadota bacterium]